MSGLKDTLGDTPYPHPARAFDGATYNAGRDYDRLSGQLRAVYDLMKDGRRRTLKQIVQQVGGNEASISARVRDLKKAKYGGLHMPKRYIGNGLWEYWMEVSR